MFEVTREEIKQCYDFVSYVWNNDSQSRKQFGTHDFRSREEFFADQISGKLAEIIFKKQVESQFTNVSVELDFQHYLNKTHTDNGDVKIYINGELVNMRYDIKSSSHRAYWLLVEHHKYIDFNTNSKMSDRYVMVKFSENMPTNKLLRKNPEQILELEKISGKIVGWARHESFICRVTGLPLFRYLREDRLLHTQDIPNQFYDKYELDNYIQRARRIGDRLDAEINYGLPIKYLDNNLTNMLIY